MLTPELFARVIDTAGEEARPITVEGGQLGRYPNTAMPETECWGLRYVAGPVTRYFGISDSFAAMLTRCHWEDLLGNFEVNRLSDGQVWVWIEGQGYKAATILESLAKAVMGEMDNGTADA